MRGDELQSPCPFHKDGQEKHPSFSIHCDDESNNNGVYHCFTCGASGTIETLVMHCLQCSYDDALNWLLSNFSGGIVQKQLELPKIEIEPKS